MKSSAHELSLLDQSIIYQVFSGRWESANLTDHKNKVFAKLKTLPFENLKSIGVDVVYLLGVFDNKGPIIVDVEGDVDISSQESRLPSIFSISDHKSTSQELGTVSDLKDLIGTLHKKGFRVILDFIANHTSTVHPWVSSHPEYYVGHDNGFVAEFSGDVYKLDYSNQKVRSEMISVLEVIASWGVDGVRCDMAHLVPLDFWEEAIKKIKDTNPNFSFIAEAYSDSTFSYEVIERHIGVGFDAVYHQHLYENLKKVYQMGESKEFIESHLNYINGRNDINTNLLSYLSNHDDPVPEGVPTKDEKLLIKRIIDLPGPALIYNGTLKGHRKRLAHHYIDILSDEYNEVLHLPNNKVLGIDIGGTNIKSAIVNMDGEATEIKKDTTDTKDYKSLILQLLNTVDSYDKNSYSMIGLSIPGVFTLVGENIFPGNLPFMLHHNIKEDLEKKVSVPVVLENDANCFALAESKWGIGKGLDTVVGITWGTGIGAGIIINGKIHHGTGAAGEFGHISTIGKGVDKDPCESGIDSCLEKCASGASLIKKYHLEIKDNKEVTLKDMFSSDDEKIKTIVSESIYYLGIGISDLIKILSPDIIVLGGGLSLMSDYWYKELNHVVRDHTVSDVHSTEVVRHSLSEDAGILGVAAVAMEVFNG